MVDLPAEFLDLLSTSDLRWNTIRAGGREWRNEPILRDAWEARRMQMREEGLTFTTLTAKRTTLVSGTLSGGLTTRPSDRAEPTPEETEQPWRLWIAPPWRRAQFVVGGDLIDVVFKGTTWWSNGHGVSMTNNGQENSRHGEGSGIDLVKTADYAAWLRVQQASSGTWLGRDTIDAAVVTPRAGADFERLSALHGLMIGEPDDLILSVDRERGVLLRTVARFKGSAYRIVEMTEVGFDEDFAPSSFEIEPLPGQEWQDSLERRSRRRPT